MGMWSGIPRLSNTSNYRNLLLVLVLVLVLREEVDIIICGLVWFGLVWLDRL